MSAEDRIEAYARALLDIAGAEGLLEEVEDELFRFGRVVAGDDRLLMALSDRSLPAERRIAVVEELLGAKAVGLTTAIAAFVAGAGRGHDLPAIADRFTQLAAAAREHEVAEVRSAVPLDAGQRERLAAALSRATGKRVEVKVVIDTKVLGGLVATVGDTVIDGSVRHRLDQLKEQI